MQRNEKGRFVAIPAAIRFWKFVSKGGDSSCWEWTGNTVGRGNDPRYGQFSKGKGSPIYAHRYSFEMVNGPIPPDMQVHHKCKNRLCVNPAHLELAIRHNHPDGAPVMRREMTHCRYGHEYTPENTFIRTTGTRRCRKCDRIRYINKVKPARSGGKSK
jgi:hypothetical protein